MLGFGKTRLNTESAYAITLVIIAETVGSPASVFSAPGVGNGRVVEIPEVALIVADVRSDVLVIEVVADGPCDKVKE